MNKEEFKKNLIRIWDSVRINHKGVKYCTGIDCRDCPLNEKVCNAGASPMFRAYEAIEAVENWAKEHPSKTNSQKFKEVFGFKPFTNNCINGEVKCDKCECNDYGVCNASRFWDAEYMPTKEDEE